MSNRELRQLVHDKVKLDTNDTVVVFVRTTNR